MAGILKVDTIQNSNTSTIITQTNSTTITIGTTGQTVALDGGTIKSGTSTLTIGASGQTVALASGATSSGFGATYNGAVNWDTTPKTTTVTAASGSGYFINTTSGAVTVNLPAGSAGSIVALSDYAATWNTNNVTVSPNGTDKIGGVNSSATLSTQGQAVTFVYVDSTKGWVNVGDATKVTGQVYITATGGTITTSGNYKIHAFTGPGTFTVSSLSCAPANNFVDYVVVAGGGGGPFGAGGAGGYRISADSSPLPVSATGYPITVGSGGSASNGSPSVFSTITSTGGGRGGPFGNPAPVGQSGGSGGGGGAQLLPSPGPGGSGNTPPVSPSQGNPGGAGSTDQSTFTNGGGGGGAGAAGSGSGGNSTSPKDGGIGRNSHVPQFGAAPQPFYPVPTGYFAGGGGGAVEIGTGIGGNGGGGSSGPVPGQSGIANSGGGGAGRCGSGGSGIVLIRYRYQ